MRFAFILPNLAGGGAEKAVLKTAQALQTRGNTVDLILLEERIDHAPPQALAVHSLGPRLARGWLGKRWLAWRLRQKVLSLVPDITVSTLPFADEVASLAQLPRHWCRIANTLSAEIDRLRQGHIARADRRQQRYQAIYGKRPLIAVSHGVACDLHERLGLLTRIETIPNPFDLAAIRQAASAHEPNLPDTPFVIHVGRFSAQKRHDLLLDAWSRLPVTHKLVLLTQPDATLAAMIAARGLSDRIVVAGFQANPYPWMAAADLLVLCSDHEGLPNVLIEALICGTPVISTDCPSGPREILGACSSAALVPCGDATALANAIEGALAFPPDVSGLDLGRFSADRTAIAYEAIAREMA